MEAFGVESVYVVTGEASHHADQYPGRTVGDRPPLDTDPLPEDDG